MSFIAEEIARQPAAWRVAAQLGSASGSGLPDPGERVAAVGCGTSWFMAEAYAMLREQRGLGETDHFAASEFPERRSYDRLVAISRSGTTTEVLDLLGRHRGRCAATVLTADPATPIVSLADHVLIMDFADERSVVQTLFATTALAALRASLGEDVAALADAAERVLANPLDARWTSSEQVSFLGRGWAHGIAREAALKMRETSQAWAEAYPSMEYRHGPISIAAPNRLVWHFGPADQALRADVVAAGALFVDNEEDPQVDLLRVQRLAAEAAAAKGLDPDRPRNLARSIVLDGRTSGPR